MFCLTHQERKVLLFIGILILAGALLRFFGAASGKDSLEAHTLSSSSLAHSEININTAGTEDLERIPGIGKVIASRIIEYRTKYGPFRDIQNLKKVKGIGHKKNQIIKKYISF